MNLHFWYVAKVSYFKGNPAHLAIVKCMHESEDPIYRVVQHDGFEELPKSKFHSFEIVKEIEEMNEGAKKYRIRREPK